MILSDTLKDSNYKLTQFSQEQIAMFEASINIKDNKGKDSAYVTCLVRKKEIKLTPEEAVRQLYVLVLRDNFGYPTERMELECSVSFGRDKEHTRSSIEHEAPYHAMPYLCLRFTTNGIA